MLFTTIFKDFIKNNNIYCGKIIKCKIISINKNFIIVDSCLKSESYIPINEFIDNLNNIEEINVGDTIDLLLEYIEDGFGKTILSRKKAKIFKTWIKLNNIYKNNEIILGNIINKIKGGFIVLIKDIKSFLPSSLLDFKLINKDIIGKILEFKIIKLDKKNNNIILSRKAVLEKENEYLKEKFIKNIKINNIVTGIVKNITNYGAFIDLGFIDGLLHITDITWKKIKHPSEIISLGDEIKLKILNFDKIKNRISLGLKQLKDDPWKDILEKYPKNKKFFGKVTSIVDYGFFIEIEEGIEGLVHITEIDWKYKNINPFEIVKINEILEIMILNIDVIKRRISLGLKSCKENPWKKFFEENNIGDKINCKIKSITNFGIFVEINKNLDGLVHLLDISWKILSKKDILNNYIKGSVIELCILNIDVEKCRIHLGIKQLIENPFNKYSKENNINDIVEGIIFDLNNNIAIVSLNKDDVLGNCIINEKNYNFDINNSIINLQTKKFKIISFDYKFNIVNLLIID